MTDKDKRRSETLVPLTGAALNQLAPGAGTALQVAMGLFGRAFHHSAERRFDCWLSDIAARLEFGTVEDAAKEIFEHCDDEWASQGVHHGVRVLLDLLDEAAVPSLAALCADYFGHQRSPDLFYKRCARLLADCRDAELRTLKLILDGVHAGTDGEPGRLEITGGESEEGWMPVEFHFRPDPCGSDLEPRAWTFEGGPMMQAVRHLLERDGFAKGSVGSDPYQAAYSQGPVSLRATTEVHDEQLDELRRLRRYIVVSSE